MTKHILGARVIELNKTHLLSSLSSMADRRDIRVNKNPCWGASGAMEELVTGTVIVYEGRAFCQHQLSQERVVELGLEPGPDEGTGGSLG